MKVISSNSHSFKLTNYLTYFEVKRFELIHIAVGTNRVPCRTDGAIIKQLRAFDILFKPVKIVLSERIVWLQIILLIELDYGMSFITKNNLNSDIAVKFHRHPSKQKVDY